MFRPVKGLKIDSNDIKGGSSVSVIGKEVKSGRNIIIIIIIEHLLKCICLTSHQSSCCFTPIYMIISRHIKFNMLKT